MESCDKDDGEEGEGAVPRTTNGTQFYILQSSLLPFLMRCGFWPQIQWYVYPWSSQSFPKERTAGVSSRSITVTNKSNCLTFSVASSLVCISPLARHHHRRTPWCPHVLQLSRVKVFLTGPLCIVAPESTGKLPFLRLFCWRSREYPFLRGKVECSLVFFFELVYVFFKIPSLASGTSLLSFSLFMGPQIS